MGQTINQTPSRRDFKGYYNSPPNAEDVDHAIRTGQLIMTKKTLGSPRIDELERLSRFFAIMTVEFDIPQSGVHYNMGFDDRSAFLSINPAERIDLKLLEAIQKHLVSRQPDWRVLVGDGEDESTIVIYPSKISYPTDENASDAIKKVVTKISQDQALEAEEESRLANQQKLASLIIKGMAPLPPPPVKPKVLLVTERLCLGESRIVVWLLESRSGTAHPSWITDDPSEDGFESVLSLPERFYGENGEPLANYNGRNGVIFGELSARTYNKAAFRNKIYLIDPKSKRRVTFTVSPDSILDDSQVSARLREHDEQTKSSQKTKGGAEGEGGS